MIVEQFSFEIKKKLVLHKLRYKIGLKLRPRKNMECSRQKETSSCRHLNIISLYAYLNDR